MRALFPLLLLLSACSGGTDADSASVTDSGASADGCAGLCTDAGYSNGNEVTYGGELVECTCEGAGAGLAQDACTAYCADFGVDADHSYLSSENGTNDKCVCDGTSG
jgi:hypothetical protein